jgi:hypothetical protein
VSDITDDTTIIAADRAVSTELDGEAVILDTAAGKYYGLNKVGARIWGLLQDPRTFGEVVDALSKEYCVDPHQCENEVRALVDQLVENDLLAILSVDAEGEA